LSTRNKKQKIEREREREIKTIFHLGKHLESKNKKRFDVSQTFIRFKILILLI